MKLLIRCVKCGQLNRVDRDRALEQSPRCGVCKTHFIQVEGVTFEKKDIAQDAVTGPDVKPQTN